jgi:hypothetical protein
MNIFEEREKAIEGKFITEGELKFKIANKCRKNLSLWAANLMQMNEEQAQKYATENVNYAIDEISSKNLVEKIFNDMKSKNVNLTQSEILKKSYEFEEIAKNFYLNN